VEENQLDHFVVILNCSGMSISFTYLGISIVDNPKKIKT